MCTVLYVRVLSVLCGDHLVVHAACPDALWYPGPNPRELAIGIGAKNNLISKPTEGACVHVSKLNERIGMETDLHGRGPGRR